MRELGADEDRYHAELARPLLAARIDHVVLVGAEMAALARALGKTTRPRLPQGPKSIIANECRGRRHSRGSALQAATPSSSKVPIRSVLASWVALASGVSQGTVNALSSGALAAL
jgi:hypothetical protein